MAKDKMDFSNPQLATPKKKISLKAKLGYGLMIFLGVAYALGESTPVPPTVSTQETREDDACYPVKTSVTMIRTAFAEGTASPQELTLLLDSAIGDWRFASQIYTGSRSDLLSKMAAQGEDVKSYILTGSPSSGPQALDHLLANMNLVNQFCG